MISCSIKINLLSITDDRLSGEEMNHRIPSSARNRQYLARNGAVVLKDLIKNQHEAHPIIQIAGSLLRFAAKQLFALQIYC